MVFYLLIQLILKENDIQNHNYSNPNSIIYFSKDNPPSLEREKTFEIEWLINLGKIIVGGFFF